MKRWILIVVVVLLLAAGGYFGVPVVVDIVVRGARLTTTELDDNRTIPDDPEDLADAAAAVVGQPVSVDEYAAARMCRSEEPHAADLVKRCLIQTACNDAKAHGWTLLRCLTISSDSTRTGFFGEQTSRRYSTRLDPYDIDLKIARLAIADYAAGNDDSQGAEKFVDRLSFKVIGKYDEVVASWAKEGLSPFTIDGVPSHLVFFRRGG